MQRQEATEGVLRVVATRPVDGGSVPLTGLSLRLVRVADTTQRVLFSTRADGQALVVAPAGDYRLRSLGSTVLGATAITWDVALTILNDRMTRIELNDRNAVPWDSLTRARDAEPAWLERSRRATVRLVAGVTKGTGIHLDTLGGLVVATTAFLGEARVVAVTGPGAAVAVQEVARDTAAGLALLRLPPGACSDCAPLRVADAAGARPGDPIMVLSRPPHHEPQAAAGRILAAGRDTLATTVMPLLPLAGGAVIDSTGALLAVLTCSCGLGVAASEERRRVIPSGRLGALLARVAAGEASGALPTTPPLPVTPEPSPAMLEVRALADTATVKAYERFVGQDAGDFRVSLITPAYLFVRLRDAHRRLGSATEWQALTEERRVVRSSGYAADWLAAFGEVTVPAVAIDVTPDVGQSTGGAFRRALLPTTKANVRFKAELLRLEIIRNGAVYEPIAGARLPVRVDLEVTPVGGGGARMHDATKWGYYLLPPEALMPDSMGAPPSIILKMFDARRPGDVTHYELRAEVVARAWNDFAPYYRAVRPEQPFRASLPGRFRSRLREVRGN